MLKSPIQLFSSAVEWDLSNSCDTFERLKKSKFQFGFSNIVLNKNGNFLLSNYRFSAGISEIFEVRIVIWNGSNDSTHSNHTVYVPT